MSGQAWTPGAERWVAIPGYPDYEVSDHGRVRSWKAYNYSGPLPRLLRNGGKGGPLPKYLAVSLTAAVGDSRSRDVHTLVALAFIGPRPKGNEVRHRNGNHLNNTLGNLTYGTRAENAQDCVRHGTHPNKRKTHCKHGHEFTEANTLIQPRGRRCRTCHREREAGYRVAKKVAA